MSRCLAEGGGSWDVGLLQMTLCDSAHCNVASSPCLPRRDTCTHTATHQWKSCVNICEFLPPALFGACVCVGTCVRMCVGMCVCVIAGPKSACPLPRPHTSCSVGNEPWSWALNTGMTRMHSLFVDRNSTVTAKTTWTVLFSDQQHSRQKSDLSNRQLHGWSRGDLWCWSEPQGIC